MGVVYDLAEAPLASVAKVVFLYVLIFPFERMFLWPYFSQIPGFLGSALLLIVFAGETLLSLSYLFQSNP
jgi:hypothetical protein